MSIIIYNQKISIIIPANIRLGEDVLKTSWKRLEDVFSVIFFCLPRRLENVLKTSWTHNCKTSCKRILNTSWKRLEDVLQDILKTSWRRLERRKVLRWRHLEDVLKTSWKTRNVCWDGCLQNFIFLFMSFSTTPIIKNSNVLAGISFIFLKKRPRPKVKVFQYQSCTSVKWSEM